MSDLQSRIDALSPAKRALLERRLREKTQRPAGGAIHPRPMAENPPLSFGQQRLWFLHQWDPGSSAYNTPLVLRIEGRLDTTAMDRSLSEIARRHEVLRTTFAADGETPVQIIRPAAPIAARRIDLTSLAPESQDAEVARLMLHEAGLPFDIGAGPVWRATLVQREPETHLLLLTVHHIVFDGWSMGVLCRELFALYYAFAAGQPSPLAELPIQYADFALWQRQHLDAEKLADQLAYWRTHLQDLPTLDLPVDHPRPAIQEFAGSMHEWELPIGVLEGLRAVSRREQATVFMTLLAAFNTLLHRYTGQDDLVVGTPIAGRTRLEMEPLIGFFVNTLVLRTDSSGDPTFRELLGRVRTVALEGFAHQDAPFEKLVEELRPRRDPSRNPLFQVMFVLQNAPSTSFSTDPLNVTRVSNPRPFTRFDLELHLHEGADGLRGTFLYNTALFDAGTIARMAEHFQVLLEAVAEDPDQRLSKLPLLTPEERRHILVDWNQTATAYPRDTCVHTLFEARARETPDALAVADGDRRMTYCQLNEQANRLAHSLRALGVGSDVPVAVCLERSMEMIVGTLAILKAGGAYVPLDPSYPRDRLAFMLADAKVSVLLTREALRPTLPHTPARVITLDNQLFADQSADNPTDRVKATDLAYVIYTSGSTGRPKGVGVPHRAVVRLVLNTNYIRICPADQIAHVCNPCFDVATFEIWAPLLSGASLIVIPQSVLLSPSDFERTLQEQRISILFLPTALFNQMAIEVPAAFRHLRYLLVGGETCDPKSVGRVLDAGSPQHVLNVYGPTESTTFTTWHRIERLDTVAASVPIGRPISNTTVHILGPGLEPVPIGVIGELYIGGDGLARNYLDLPELTAERFIPDPFDETPSARLYKSGDFARYRPDGRIDFVGRIDGQVKIRGFRVELQEVEAALSHHPDVSHSVVIPRHQGQPEASLVAYVVPSANAQPSPDALRRYLAERLPEYMIPGACVVLAALPLTPNGKVDHAALPAPERTAREEAPAFIAPRTAVEQGIAEIWEGLLGVTPIGIHDNFFDLGGHSLLAMRVIARIEKRFGRTIPVTVVFQSPTLEELAMAMSDQQPPASLVAPARPRPPGPKPPLSFGQERLWFLHQWDPRSSAYNIAMFLRIEGRLDTAAMDRSLTEIARRHEALRTTFAAEGEARVQIVLPAAPMAARRIDLTGLSSPLREAEEARLVRAEAELPFDLVTGPIWRATLVRLDPKTHLLLLTVHHIVFDGWSMGVLQRELFTLYHAFTAGKASPLPELPIQYADFALWQRRHLQGDVLAEQVTYWRRQLQGLATLDLPIDHPRPAVQTFAGAVHEVRLPPRLAEDLRALSRQQQATLFMTLLAAFQTLLHRYTGQDDIVVGTPIAGRTRMEVEESIGFFVNMLVLRTDTSGDPTFRELLDAVRTTALEGIAHQETPFEKLVEELHPRRDPSRNPLFQVVFALQNAPSHSFSPDALNVTRIENNRPFTRFDLEVHFQERDGGLRGRFVYNTALFEAETITRLAGHFGVLLEAVAADPDQRLSQLPLLTPRERHQILVDWNQTATGYPRNACIHTLFEARAKETPDALAVEYGDRRMSYRQLNEQANRLAHFLGTLGVAPDVPVGICVDRSIDLIVGLLAILKAGGAYVPFDPSYPSERLRFMLDDAQIATVLTESSLTAHLPTGGTRVVCMDDPGWEDNSPDNPDIQTTATRLAYILYTSGSTGQPKGVTVPHRAVVRLVMNTDYVQISASDRFAQASNQAFDAATFEIWGALLNGAALIGISRDVLLSPRRFSRAIRDSKISILFLTTALFNQIAADEPRAFQLLRYLLVGGETCDPKWVRTVLEAGPPQHLVNAYGPTENTTFSTSYRVEHVAPDARTVPIGRPIANTRAYLLDRALQPAPIGVIGEVHLAGDGLARGYLNRKELTAETFVRDPFSAYPSDRLYKTGDFARYLPDGRIDFVGRIDQQVKLRGFRIELQEIEAVLSHHPDVSQSVVIASLRDGAEHSLVAYVVPGDGANPSTDALRGFLREKLPEYMVPSAFVFLPSLPMTPNGKVDQAALPPPEQVSPERTAGFVAPRNRVEQRIAEIWETLLGIKRVGIHDNFFDLGGHSLLAIQLITRIEKAFGGTVPVAVLFQSPTIAQLAEVLADARLAGPWSALIPVRATGCKMPFFWVHGDSSNAHLAGHLGADRPIFALEHQGADGLPAAHVEVRTIARHYLQEVRTVRPHGPYLLGGYSFGAAAAFEMACQLAADGEEVRLLFMLDPPAQWHMPQPHLHERVHRLFERAPTRRFDHKVTFLLRRLSGAVRGRLDARRGKVMRSVNRLRTKAYLLAGRVLPPSVRSRYILDIYSRALRSYAPQRYPGNVTIFKGAGLRYMPPLDWPALVGGHLDVYEEPGDHMEMTKDPLVAVWAVKLKEALDQID